MAQQKVASSRITTATAEKRLWVEKPGRLKFAFAGVAFYAVNFHGWVLDHPASETSTTLFDPPLLPLADLTPGVRTVCICSHPVQTNLPSLAFLPNAIRYVPFQYRRFYTDIRGSFDDYLRTFSTKSRRNLRRKMRRFSEFSGGPILWREFRRPLEMAEFHRLAKQVSKTTYQERLLDSGIPDTRQFREELTSLAARHAVRGYILFHHGTPIAYALCFAKKEVLTYEKTGFNPAFAHSSPGTVLLYLMLQKLFEESDYRQFDFGKGESGFKEYFSTSSIRCADIYYFARTLDNASIVLAHCLLEKVSAQLKKGLEHLGLRAGIKKFIHRNLSARLLKSKTQCR